MTQLTVKSFFALVSSFHSLTQRLPLCASVQTRKLGEIPVPPTRPFRLASSRDTFLSEFGKTPPAGACQPPEKGDYFCPHLNFEKQTGSVDSDITLGLGAVNTARFALFISLLGKSIAGLKNVLSS